MNLPFPDRASAGRRLAAALESYRGRDPLIVLALPRGGVPVAAEVVAHIGGSLDVMIVRKLGLPGQDELAMGAIASGGIRILNQELIAQAAISEAALQAVTARERLELARRERVFRGERPWPELHGATVILVDDGLATGASMRAAVSAVREFQPREVVVAVPVAPPDTIRVLRGQADAVVCLETPEPFRAIGLWYGDFTQVADAEVRRILQRCWTQ
ncbi:phosphoribosyltransferase [Haliea sp. E1-2-M8]|uniref:phosphoribosyltransferase n=1 Tax=Haliea sp. E1-2-M8 TaxID=3064706 RepID=UPI0027254C42|nr:phosphoribosyltransferase [Haliea sp. E1-2-M8]MDO8860755.1 phosphoribosyltransferase [Haliea sp. E1-2-M8]